MKADLIVHNIKQLMTLKGKNQLRIKNEMRELNIIQDAYLIIKDGKFIEVGSGEYNNDFVCEETKVVDAKGAIVTPGLIDSHTHLVHGGTRENELEMKLEGVPYLEILKQGGGILSTVKSTQKASFDDLYQKAKKSLDIMLTYGVTSVEAKSGYGLELETEMKQLEVAKKLNEDHPIDVKSTFLGAHAIPVKYRNHKRQYIDEVINMLPVIKKQNLAEYCDVFCEEGVFSVSESQEILLKAKELGYKLKIHADEIIPLGGAKLAANIGCVSADHLMASTNEDLKALAEKQVVCNLLPGTSFNLNKNFANARKMIDLGCGVSLSSDYNPGSCPTENLQLIMQLASLKMRLLPSEVLTAVTMNGACSINEELEKGSIEVGKIADFVLFDAPNIDYIIYHFGVNHVKDVYKNGILVVENQQCVY